MSSVFKLIIEDDAGRQIVVPFSRDQISIGRKEGNTIRLTERNVSRNHALLSRENGHVVLEDLGSFNGVKVNGDRIEGRVSVAEGDTIQIGDYHLALHVQEQDSGGKPGGGSSSGSQMEGGPDDQFAGDTQRWVASSGRSGEDSQGLPTQEERPATAAGLLDLSSSPSFPAERDDPNAGLDLEATLRQTAAPPPITQPTSQPAVSVPTPAFGRPIPAAAGSGGANGATGSSDGEGGARPAAVASGAAPARGASARPTLDETGVMPPAPPPGEELRHPRLVVLNTIFAGSTFQVRNAEMVIGRTTDSDITIEHRSVSRNHAKVVRDGDRVRIVDLKSANGILVNDEEVESAVLRSGDVVELGHVRVRFVPIGERFGLSQQEIERARLDDTSAGEFEAEARTSVTSPVRPKGTDAVRARRKSAPAASSSKAPMIGAVVLVAIIIVAIALAMSGPDAQPTPEPSPQATQATQASPANDGAPVDRAAQGAEGAVGAAGAAPTVAADQAGAAADAVKAEALAPDEKRPPKAVLDSYKSEGLKAFLKGDWREAAEFLGYYRKWIKDDKIVNDNFQKAQEKLRR